MELSGKVIAILPAKGGISRNGNEWKAQEYVIETHDQYPRKMLFDVFGADKIQQFNIQMGEEITVQFDIDARQWNDRWFNSIRAWRIDRGQAPQEPAPQPAQGFAPASAAPASSAPDFSQTDSTDDLPF